ncbi:hypothetical protein [Aeromonas caviae]|uniref:Uncharacterized protein n=1 Tax=Aeromonas caviae TaxID=648 RepID=A0AAJ5ZH85_AERCA|nr:hypothetical protein [Aeromonas caviae]RWT81330.1 hypothetical protein DN604_00750 [Aeromonas caviae]WFG00354.1 hypothetical protein P5S46_21565 [Aeromonas caviae]
MHSEFPDVPLHVLEALSSHPKTLPETLASLYAGAVGDYAHLKEMLLRNTTTPPHTLVLGARENDVNLRRLVASNKSAPEEVLWILAEDESASVRRLLQQHQKMGIPIWVMMATADVNDDIRQVALSNLNMKSVTAFEAEVTEGRLSLGLPLPHGKETITIGDALLAKDMAHIYQLIQSLELQQEVVRRRTESEMQENSLQNRQPRL